MVAWSVKNRVIHASWWGKDWNEVLTKPFQYSSMTAKGDNQLVKYPDERDTSWMACLDMAAEVYGPGGFDVSKGATHYYDKTLDANPPEWAKASGSIHLFDAGAFHFYRAH